MCIRLSGFCIKGPQHVQLLLQQMLGVFAADVRVCGLTPVLSCQTISSVWESMSRFGSQFGMQSCGAPARRLVGQVAQADQQCLMKGSIMHRCVSLLPVVLCRKVWVCRESVSGGCAVLLLGCVPDVVLLLKPFRFAESSHNFKVGPAGGPTPPIV